MVRWKFWRRDKSEPARRVIPGDTPEMRLAYWRALERFDTNMDYETWLLAVRIQADVVTIPSGWTSEGPEEGGA